jgi:hypothetical protein
MYCDLSISIILNKLYIIVLFIVDELYIVQVAGKSFKMFNVLVTLLKSYKNIVYTMLPFFFYLR